MSRSLCNVSLAGATALMTLVLLACGGGEQPPPATATMPTASAPATTAVAAKPAPPNPATLTAADCLTMGAAPTAPGAPVDTKGRVAEVTATFQRHRDRFRCCYDVARQQTPRLEGKYAIEVILKPDGSLKQVQSARAASEFVDERMETCAQSVVKGLSFAPNSEGKESTVTYPFTFTPGGNRQ